MDSVQYLLSNATSRDKMAEIIIKYKKELSSDYVRYLLRYAEDKEQMAKILGADNINKLSSDYVYDLLRFAEDKKQMAQIIDKYHQKKTPEIQKLIDKYLS